MKITKILIILIVCSTFIFGGMVAANAGNSAVANAGASASGGAASITNDGMNQTSGDITITFPEQKDITTQRSVGEGFRDFPTPGSVVYPGTPSYFGHATPGSAFQSVKVILDYKDTFSVDELKMMAKHEFGIKVLANPLVAAVPEEKQSKNMAVFLGKPSRKVQAVAFITVRATSERTSAELLAKAMLEARKYGAEAIQVTAEGVERQIESFGWGIGLAYSYASINANEDRGGIGTGGTGVSGGHAGYKDKPWLRVVAVKFIP